MTGAAGMPNRKIDPARAKRYLAAALKLNPVVDGERIVMLRSKYLRLQSPKSAVSQEQQADLREVRQSMSSRIENIRKSFWKSDIGQIQKGLGQLKLEQFPDLRLARERLLTLAEHRHEFGLLAEKGIVDPKFFNSLREFLVAPPGIAASKRDELIESIKSPARLKKVRSMTKTIRKLMPEIYKLEVDWLEAISRMQKRKVKKESTAEAGDAFDFDFEGFGWVGWFVVIALVRLLLKWGGGND